MNRIRTRLGLSRGTVEVDAGLSLVEVIVALLIFSIITLGSITAVGTVLGMSSDARSREVATNLASQAVDAAQATTNIFDLTNSSSSTSLNGTSFTVTQSVSWITTTGVDSQCTVSKTNGNGALLYKHVNITVGWGGKNANTKDVRQDTIVAPSSKINDPATGTILISVYGATGAPVSGVTATVAPDSSVSNNTASTLDSNSQPALTNADGCSIATKVKPGTYTITLGSAAGKNDRDPDQNATPTKTVSVAAGDSAGASFSYDAGDDFSMTYANFPANYVGTALVPTDLDTTILTTGHTYTASTPDPDQFLYPTSSGYQFIAGTYVPAGGTATSCLSPDPESWPKSSTNKVGHRVGYAANSTTKSGQSYVPMGVVTINLNRSTDKVIRAKTTTATGGDPGCAAGMTYNFTRSGTGSTATIALPYGTWSITSGASTSSLATTTIGSLIGAVLGILAPAASTNNIVTLDPRVGP